MRAPAGVREGARAVRPHGPSGEGGEITPTQCRPATTKNAHPQAWGQAAVATVAAVGVLDWRFAARVLRAGEAASVSCGRRGAAGVLSWKRRAELCPQKNVLPSGLAARIAHPHKQTILLYQSDTSYISFCVPHVISWKGDKESTHRMSSRKSSCSLLLASLACLLCVASAVHYDLSHLTEPDDQARRVFLISSLPLSATDCRRPFRKRSGSSVRFKTMRRCCFTPWSAGCAYRPSSRFVPSRASPSRVAGALD